MIDKPLYDNPLGGGASYFNPIGHTPNSSIGMQNPGEGNLANLEDGLMFLIDKDRPRTEDEIKSLYQKAQEDAARQRREGVLGQVVLPGEMSYEDYRGANLYNFKRNPNIPDSAYKDFDMRGIAGFDNPTIDDASMKGLPETNEPPMFATPGLPPPEEPSLSDIIDPVKTVQGPEDTLNPYDRVGQQLMGPNQDEVLGTLQNIEKGIASLVANDGQNFKGNKSSNYKGFDNFDIGDFFPPYGGMYG